MLTAVATAAWLLRWPLLFCVAFVVGALIADRFYGPGRDQA